MTGSKPPSIDSLRDIERGTIAIDRLLAWLDIQNEAFAFTAGVDWVTLRLNAVTDKVQDFLRATSCASLRLRST